MGAHDGDDGDDDDDGDMSLAFIFSCSLSAFERGKHSGFTAHASAVTGTVTCSPMPFPYAY